MTKPVRLTFYNTRRKPVFEDVTVELSPEGIQCMRDMVGCNISISDRNISGVLMKVVEILETYPV